MSCGIRIKWLGTSCFELDFGGKTVVTDPFITEAPATDFDWQEVEHCDAITVSHTHFDHITDIPRLCEKFRPRVFVGELSARALIEWTDYAPHLFFPAHPGLEVELGGLSIRALYGRHTSLGLKYSGIMANHERNPLCAGEKMMELQSWGIMEYRNWLFTTADGASVLVWGGYPTSDAISALRGLDADILLMQCTSDCAEKYTELIRAVGAKTVVPHHLDFPMGKIEDRFAFAAGLKEQLSRTDPDVEFIIPEYKKWLEL